MKIFKSKKSSLELSIRTIVIVVLAMTLLGLGLGFIRGMFGSITPLTEDVTEQVRQKILDDLITTDKKVSFPKTEITIDRGGSQTLTVGVRNKNPNPLDYKMNFELISGPATIDPDNWFQYAPSPSDDAARIGEADYDVRNMRLSMPKTATPGSYFLKFEVWDDAYGVTDPEHIYATKDFFIVVRS